MSGLPRLIRICVFLDAFWMRCFQLLCFSREYSGWPFQPPLVVSALFPSSFFCSSFFFEGCVEFLFRRPFLISLVAVVPVSPVLFLMFPWVGGFVSEAAFSEFSDSQRGLSGRRRPIFWNIFSLPLVVVVSLISTTSSSSPQPLFASPLNRRRRPPLFPITVPPPRHQVTMPPPGRISPHLDRHYPSTTTSATAAIRRSPLRHQTPHTLVPPFSPKI